MRRSALFLAFAVTLTSFVGLLNPAAYAAATITVSNTTPFPGQEVIFSGNIGVNNAPVTLQRDTASGWTNTRDAVSTGAGDYSFQLGTLSAQRLFRVVINGQGVKTPTVVLKTKSFDTAPETASKITSTPKKPYVNQPFKLTGNTNAGARDVMLQRLSGGNWVETRTGTAAADGKYSFDLSTAAAAYDFRTIVMSAGTSDPAKSPVLAFETKKNEAGLVVSRVGSSTSIVADAYLSADLDGREVELQKAGNGWTKVKSVAQTGNSAHFTGLSKSTTYRVVARALADGTPQVISNSAALTYGPSSLGDRLAYITTMNGGTPKTKGKDYAATILINGVLASLETVAVRGNTSATYPKKGYKIKFDDNISPLPGIPVGKTFNLVPDYQDRSLIRTAVTFTAADQMDGMVWNPHRAFVELYINGKYLGAYDLIESVKIEDGSGKSAARIPVNPATGVVIEIDPFGAQDGVPHWKSSKSKLPFKFKDPDQVDSETPAEGITTAKAKGMKAKVEKFEAALYGPDWKSNTKGWQAYMDMNSAVDWYLTKEFIKDWDGDMYRSNFFWTNNWDPNSPDKLFMSPIWDVDRSAAAKTSGTSSVTSPNGWWMNGDGGGHLNNSDNVHTTHWFVRIAKDPDFQAALKVRWDQKQTVFKNAGDQYVDDAVAELGKNVAANDRALWAKTGDAKRYVARSSSYNGEVAFVKKWYKDRYSWMTCRLYCGWSSDRSGWGVADSAAAPIAALPPCR
jgi:hypothetical protein